MLLSITAAYLSLIGAEIENSLIVWCQSLGIFSQWSNRSLLGALHFPFCDQLQGVQPHAKSWAEPVKCEGCNGREEVLAQIRNQTSSSTFLLHCSKAVGAAAAER